MNLQLFELAATGNSKLVYCDADTLCVAERAQQCCELCDTVLFLSSPRILKNCGI